MLALSQLFSAAAAAVPEVAPAEDREIIVIARKLDMVTLNFGRDSKGRLHCTAVRSSGVPNLDAQLCEATARCLRKGDWSETAVKQCVEKAKPALIANVRSLLKERRVRELEGAQKAGT